MKNEQHPIADDPRVTAYALGELEGEEAREVEQLLANDPRGSSEVAELREEGGFYGEMIGSGLKMEELAQRIESQVRVSDVAARYGGEEFVVLLPGTEIESGTLLAERIRKAVSAKPIEIGGGNSITITVSIGIASVAPDRDADNLKTAGESLLARADVALYSAKSAGRDQVATEHADNASAIGRAVSP